ncbi:MAG: metallophosphoesterase [Lachnospiraceae bacterium]|nr:metallophosphoesterase [Lachnospiraceae bacterium]
MKMIHCSDIHLDAVMSGFKDSNKAEERRNEILLTFVRMVRYASKNDVRAILIVGDLFDSDRISPATLDIVEKCISGNPGIDFYYTAGNHEKDAFLNSLESIPENLKTFRDTKTYRYDEGITVSAASDPSELNLSSSDFNIVLYHGTIRPNAWKTHDIDYLALGHFHELKEGSLGSRGRYCYSGCLEGRGFDECGEKGFVRLNIENGMLEPVFMQAAKRTIHELSIDISSIRGTGDADALISDELERRQVPEDDLIKIVLTGRRANDINTGFLEKKYGEEFYAVHIVDETTAAPVKTEGAEYDISLKGEFIRMVMEKDWPEDEKQAVIEMGTLALGGKNIL